MNLQIIGIFIQAHLLAKILTVQAPALEDNNHDFTWMMNKRYERLSGTELSSVLLLISTVRARLKINARLKVYAPPDTDAVVSDNPYHN